MLSTVPENKHRSFSFKRGALQLPVNTSQVFALNIAAPSKHLQPGPWYSSSLPLIKNKQETREKDMEPSASLFCEARQHYAHFME